MFWKNRYSGSAVDYLFRKAQGKTQPNVQKRSSKLASNMATIAIALGAFFFCKEIYSFLIYSLGVRYYLPQFLRHPSNNLNMVLLFLSYWLMLFCYYLKKGNTRAQSMLSIVFCGLWGLWFLLCLVYRRESFALGNLFFHLPDRIVRMFFCVDSALVFWVAVKSFWPTDEKKRTIFYSIIGIGILIYVYVNTSFLLGATWAFTTDDAYITLRYSRHIAEGHGILWNLGEPPVEGYSNFTFVLLGAACLKAGTNPMSVFKMLNCVMLFGTCLMLYFLARRWVNPVAAALPAVFLTAYRGTIWWTVSGLETATYQFLVVAAILLFFRGLRFDRVGPDSGEVAAPESGATREYRLWFLWWAGIVAFLASLTRPEGPLVFLALSGALVIRIVARVYRQRRASDIFRNTLQEGVRAVVALSIGFAIGYGAFMGWRFYYFEQFVPNPVLVKSGFPRNPMEYLDNFWAMAAPFILFSLIQNYRRLDVRYVVVWGIPLAYAVILYNVDPFMGYQNRLFLPAFAVVLVPAAVGLVGIVDIGLFLVRNRAQIQDAASLSARRWKHEVVIILWFLAVLATLRVGSFARFRAMDLKYSAEKYAARMETRRALGEWIDSQLGPDDWYSIGDAGMVPYVTKAKVLDSLGLNCREYSLPPINRSAESFADYIVCTRPSMIAIPSISPNKMSPNGPGRPEGGIRYVYAAMLSHPEFQEQYEHVKTFAPPPPDNYNYFVYRLED